MNAVWHDKDRRRAVLLSILVHVAVLLALVLFVSLPRPTPLEPFVIIDVGTPAPSDTDADAATVETPAPAAERPEVEAERVGRPTREQPPVEAETPTEAEPTTQAPEDAEPAPPEAPTPRAVTPPAPPAPVAPAPSPLTEALPGSPAAPLPEIEQEPLAPRPLAESIPVPQPAVTAELPPTRTIAPQPRAEVAPAQQVPVPVVAASVPEAQAVPTPQASAQVAAAESVPTPNVQSEVAAPVRVPRPSAQAVVSAQVAVPRPTATAQVAAPRSVPQPDVRVSVATPAPAADAAAAQEVPAGVPAPRGNRATRAPEGGSASRPGQVDPAAEAAGLGAARTTGEGASTGARVRPEPYSAFRQAPVAILIDNAEGYPQSGLVQASIVVEMPVEGGLTRLMPLYHETDPPQVGPVRSARDYFVRVSESYDGVLVHDGGSPSALEAIQRSSTPTLNAFSRGELFVRVSERGAPYNLYSTGDALRRAVNRLRTGGVRSVSGVIYRPPQGAREVAEITVRYGGTYQTGFAYQPTVASYRWVRNGTPAVDAVGEQVRTEAVLVAQIEARPFPNDPAGRLYVPLDGGPATLYVRGRAVDGSWFLDGGVRFQTADGEILDLRPFKTWMVFAPTYESRVER